MVDPKKCKHKGTPATATVEVRDRVLVIKYCKKCRTQLSVKGH